MPFPRVWPTDFVQPDPPGASDFVQPDTTDADPEVQQTAQQVIEQFQPWRQWANQEAVPPEEPDWQGLPPEQYLQEHPPFDFHNDPEALDAILPESPKLHWWQDKSHPQNLSRAGSLMRVLRYAAVGGLAGQAGAEQSVVQSGGRVSGGFGTGFSHGLAAVQNLQALQARRQAMQDVSDYRRAQTQRMRTQTAGIPQQQADLSAYRQARTQYVKGQQAKVEAQINKLKERPNDKLVHSYNAADGKVHFLYQKANGDTYEKTSEQNFYQRPTVPARPLLAHGPDHGVYLIDPDTGHSRLIISPPPNAPPKRASADYFRKVDDWKDREWKKAMNDVLLTEDERTQRLQAIQDHYERAIATGGGDVAHYDVRTGTLAGPTRPGAGSKNDPLGIR